MEEKLNSGTPVTESDSPVAVLEKTSEKINLNNLDYKKQYSNETYAEYICSFKRNEKSRLGYRFVKRTVDIIVSLVALIVLSPIFLILAIIIKLDSKGPVIFKQARIGKNGKKFMCYKFRSMKTSAPSNCPTNDIEDLDGQVTKVGKIIRRLSADELPQLFCCLIGTMSLIGYRPLIPEETECNEMREALGVFVMRPGITGYAQVVGRDDVYYKNKAILDAEYVKNASIAFDIKILFQTIGVVLSHKGAK